MAKTIQQGFDMFLSWLVPLQTEYDKSISHKDSVSVNKILEILSRCSYFFFLFGITDNQIC